MNYRLRDRINRRSSKKQMYLAFGILALTLLVFRIALPNFSSGIAYMIATPFWAVGESISNKFDEMKTVFADKDDLIEKNKQLSDELLSERVKLLATSALQSENDELRDLLNLSDEIELFVVPIVAKPPVSPYDTLILDIGDRKDINPGDQMFVGGGFVLGQISEVHGSKALGKLYSTAGNSVAVVIERTGVFHEISGAGAGNFEFKVPKEFDVLEGDILSLPGARRKILGEVRNIESLQSESFKKVYVRSPVNIFELQWVGIGKN